MAINRKLLDQIQFGKLRLAGNQQPFKNPLENILNNFLLFDTSRK